jgi:hypothetical protein
MKEKRLADLAQVGFAPEGCVDDCRKEGQGVNVGFIA